MTYKKPHKHRSKASNRASDLLVNGEMQIKITMKITLATSQNDLM